MVSYVLCKLLRTLPNFITYIKTHYFKYNNIPQRNNIIITGVVWHVITNYVYTHVHGMFFLIIIIIIHCICVCVWHGNMYNTCTCTCTCISV